MNRKYNPFVSLVALLLAAIILVLTCTGCVPAAAETETEPAPRLICEWVGSDPTGGDFYIITDTETGVQYLAWKTSRGVAMTVRHPVEG